MEALELRLSQASDRLQRLAASNAPYGSKVNAEQNYALAYQALVRVGLRPQLRAKYKVA